MKFRNIVKCRLFITLLSFLVFLSTPIWAQNQTQTRYVYLLDKPIDTTVKLGPVAKSLHYGVEIGFQFVQAGVWYYATGEPISTLLFLTWELAKTPPMLTAQSLADLEARYRWLQRKGLQSLAKIPAVSRITILTSSDVEFKKFLAHTQNSRGLVFIETSQPLPPEVRDNTYGNLIPILDLENTRLRIRLTVGETANSVEWNPSLKDILDKTPIPKEIADAWRKEVSPPKERVSLLTKVRKGLKPAPVIPLQLEASLVGPTGEQQYLGVIAQSNSVKKILGETKSQKALEKVRSLLTKKEPKERPLSLIQATVYEKGGLRTCLRNVLQNLLGHAVVRPN